MTRLHAALAIASLLAAGCGASSSPASPSPASFAGAWDGKVLAAPQGVLTTAALLHLSLDTSATQLAGTWTMTFPNGHPNVGGTASGVVNADGSAMSVTLASTGNCPVAVSGTLNGMGTQITGQYSESTDCRFGIVAGSDITFTKQ